MITPLVNRRSKAVLGIAIVSIGTGAISKKVINYPAVGCMKVSQEITFIKDVNKYFI